jgi:catechol 2,3-dioxygenase-like lactoylglutathione lyase family enzyme
VEPCRRRLTLTGSSAYDLVRGHRIVDVDGAALRLGRQPDRARARRSLEEVHMTARGEFPSLLQVVLDTTDARRLAEFYRELLGLRYRPGDEPPGPGEPDPQGEDWLVLRDSAGANRLAFQQVAELPAATWPEGPIPQQLHLDLTVPSTVELDAQHERALALGAGLLLDRSDDPQEPLRVYADPAGHPFCIFVVPD